MLCNKCKKNNATFYYTQTVNGETVSFALCNECKAKYFDKEFTQNTYAELKDFYGSFFSDEVEEGLIFPKSYSFGSVKSGDMPENKRCVRCGATFSELTKGKKDFCPHCYIEFKDMLSSFLVKIHGSDTYKGKNGIVDLTPDDEISNTEVTENDNLLILKQKLTSAISDERYEDAAKIRDEIRKIEGKV